MKHVFPDKITEHKIVFTDGSKTNLLVSPTETYGKALARAGYSDVDVASITLKDSPLHYEPDFYIGSK